MFRAPPARSNIVFGGKRGATAQYGERQMSVIFENAGLRIFHVLTETTLAGINVSDPDTKNISRVSFFGLVEPTFFSFA